MGCHFRCVIFLIYQKVNLTKSDDFQPTRPAIAKRGQTALGVRSAQIQKMLLKVICFLVLMGMLVVGLWPFHVPRNDVRWLTPETGLAFGKHGSIVTSDDFAASPEQPDESCSIEIWLEPARVDASGTILSFYRSASQTVPFALRQSLGDLVFEHDSQDRSDKRARIYVDDVFARRKPVFVTISSGKTGTTIYVDGALVKKAARFWFSSRDLTGQLVIGNAPDTNNSWSGHLKGLVLYHRAISAAEVSEHFGDWAMNHPLHLEKRDGVVASYLFDERQGNIVRNRVDDATDLTIPGRFFIVRPRFLELPWEEYRPDWNYWGNVGVNIGGFIPLGFLFCALLSAMGRDKQAAWLTIALGFAVSLTIEVLQAFLPTRDSGMTDLITNTFGTALGVILNLSFVKNQYHPQPGSQVESQSAVYLTNVY